jgi:hypothetical protein
MEVGDEGLDEFIYLSPPNFRSEGLAHPPSVRGNLTLTRVSFHPPVARLEFEVKAEMEAGKRINVDDPPVAGFDGGEIEGVGPSHLGLDPLEILSRIEGIDVNPCSGHRPSMFGIPPTIGGWRAGPTHPGEDWLTVEEEGRCSVMRPDLDHLGNILEGRCL